MVNASRCRARAIRYAKLAVQTEDPEARRALRALARIWHEMAPVSESFDRESDESAKERIYRMIDAVAEERRKVA